MGALTADRKVAQYGTPDLRDPLLLNFPVAASAKLYGGAIAGTDTAGRLKLMSSPAQGDIVWGLIDRIADNSSGGAGAIRANVKQGVFYMANGTSADAIAVANRGQLCYVIDDQTVGLTDGSGTRPVAGMIVDVDSALGVAVDFGRRFGMAASNVEYYEFVKPAADGAAGTATTESILGAVTAPGVVTAVRILPAAALTADNTNNAVITIAYRRAAGAAQTIATFTTNVAAGNWVAWTAIVAASLTNTSLQKGDMLTIAIAKGGTGVIVPISAFQVEVQPLF